MKSRRTIRNIALPILLVLTLAQCSGTVPEHGEKAPGYYLDEEAPAHSLRTAQMVRKGWFSFGNPDAMRDYLRLFALNNSEEEARKNRAYLVKVKWSSDLIKALDQTLVWGRAMRDDPRRAYDLSKVHRDRGTQLPRPFVASALLRLAANAGLPEARFDRASGRLDEDGKGSQLKYLADEDYLPAQMDMVRRYTDGDGLKKDNAKAYYWLSRAFQNGAKVSDRHRRLGDILTADDFGQVASWYMRDWTPSP